VKWRFFANNRRILALILSIPKENMTRSKMLPALVFLMFATLLSTPQNTPSASPVASAGESFVPPFYWKPSNDVNKWLKDHESFLQRGDGCSLNRSFVNSQARSYGSAVNNVALFMIAPGDDLEENSTMIHDEVSGLDIRVGARYLSGDAMEELEIALAFDGEPDNVFNEITAAEAHSLRDKNWKYLTLVKKIQLGDVEYRYSLACENGKTFMSFLRKPAKHRRRSS
jgi:hypothetical protein